MSASILTADECVLRNLLDRFGKTQPQKVFARMQNSTEWTYAETLRRARQISGTLHRLGVRRGDNVFCWLPNSAAFIETWFGANYMGAVFVSANIAYRGGILEHILGLASAKVGIVHADLLPRLGDIKIPFLERVIVVGGPPSGSFPGITLYDESILAEPSEPAPLEAPIQPWDSAFVIFTSGTTGLSKAVLSSYIHAYSFFREGFPHLVGADERFMIFLPMFHAGGTQPTFAQLTAGGSVAIIESFKTTDFWNTVRETKSTTASLLGVMAPFLLKQPPSPDDKTHGLKAVSITPLSEDAREFGLRFGVGMCTGYGMSELCAPVTTELNPKKLGISGRLRPGFQVRLVDENDCEVPEGQVGEFIIRADRPWCMLTEYYKNPEATAAAWRNGWFHTGDLLRRDEEGYYYFVDRRKDAMRRRGENISSHEVEMEILKHPAIREVAAFAAKSEIAEDEVMVCISTPASASIEMRELLNYLIPRMPHFMLPRYIRVMDELPKTPTGKILKDVLRQQGITEDTWDREAHGVVIKREKIGVAKSK
jgi:crotonobetaine/carnitine-CoA ligase